jgi:hypothetical protein
MNLDGFGLDCKFIVSKRKTRGWVLGIGLESELKIERLGLEVEEQEEGESDELKIN